MLKLNAIHNIDCMKGFESLPDKSIDLVLTDIPYTVVNRESNGLRNLSKDVADVGTFELPNFVAQCIRVSKGSIYIFCGTEQVSDIRDYMVKSGLSTRLIVWEKTNPSPMNGEYIWLSGIEVCVYGKFPGATFNEYCKNTVFRFPGGKSKLHPTEKSLELFEYLVKASSNVGDIVLDPCIGGGTTAIACLQSSRKYLGFEIDPNYFRMAVERVERWKHENPILYAIHEKDYQ